MGFKTELLKTSLCLPLILHLYNAVIILVQTRTTPYSGVSY